MNTQSNAAPEAPQVPHPAASAPLSPVRPLYWSVRRELWENRSIFVAPLVVASVVLLGFLISAVHLPDRFIRLAALDPAAQHALVSLPYDISAVLIIVTSVLVGWFYCLDALHGERRDRSILFWKSLPVSDLTTVLSKVGIPLVVLPLIAFATVVCMHMIMLLLSSAILLASGASATLLWTQSPVFRNSGVLLYGLAVLALWSAPVYCWLLLVSAWAQRSTFLWAVLPPLGLAVVEKIAFDTSYFASMLKRRLLGSYEEAFVLRAQDTAAGHRAIPLDPVPDPWNFITTPGLWIGLAVAAAFLAGAIWLRRHREPI